MHASKLIVEPLIRDLSNRRFFDRLGVQLGYRHMDDWYNVTEEDVWRNGGESLLKHYYYNSPSVALQSVYPEHIRIPWKFRKKPPGFWKNKVNHRNFFDWLKTQLGYKRMDDWYNVTQEDVCKNGGEGLLIVYYKCSCSTALQQVYPEHDWMLWRFKIVPRGFWDNLMHDTREVIRMVEWLGGHLSVRCLDDWYRVSLQQIRKWVLVGSTQELSRILQTAYPQHRWDNQLLHKLGLNKSSQRELFLAVQALFPTHNVQEDYKHSKMIHSSGQFMELDVFIEELKLAVEYQGIQHYKPVYWPGADFATQVLRDEEKRKACKQHDICLVEVPYWWNRTKESLAATIHRARTELLSAPPGVPPVASLAHTKASFSVPISHGYPWDGFQDITGWWMSEKMDGVRAFWNGNDLISRKGNEVLCPSWFISSLPVNITLDGELWMGPQTTCEDVVKIMVTKTGDWGKVGFYVFDIPSSPGFYEERMKEMEAMKGHLPPHVHIVENIRCTGTEHLFKCLESVVAATGEGLMLRQPHSLYEPHLTTTLLKVKKFEDTEVKLLEISDKGLVCQQSNGLVCTIKCFESTLRSPPPLGSVVTVKHNGVYSTGILKNPIFWRETTTSLQSTKVVLDWNNLATHKQFFHNLMRHMNIHHPTDWYKVGKEDVYSLGGQKLFQRCYDDSLYKVGLQSVVKFQALTHCYPGIEISPWKFHEENVPVGFWKSSHNLRNFFDQLYVQLGFKCMDDWFSLVTNNIHNSGGRSVRNLLRTYNSSPSSALQIAYPEHGWPLEKFKHKPSQLWNKNDAQRKSFLIDNTNGKQDFTPMGFWTSKTNQSKFFNWLMTELGYKSMDDWYNVTVADIYKHGGGGILVEKYKNSPSRALQSIYPEHNRELERFKKKPQRFWKDAQNRRNFFDWLMTVLGYQSMDDWYSVTVEDIYKHGGRTCLCNSSPSEALENVYPEHQWELDRFKHKPKKLWNKNDAQRKSFLIDHNLDRIPKGFWRNVENHRKFFDWLMSVLGFTCMDDWYNVTLEDIYSNGGSAILYTYYNASPSLALQSIYPEHKWSVMRFKNKPQRFWK